MVTALPAHRQPSPARVPIPRSRITFDDATVSTAPGFSVVTADPRSVSITGDGALSYTAANNSTLTAADTALYIRSNGDVAGGNPGSITVNTNGALTGGNFGVDARNYGSGALSVTANGDVTATSVTGIYARNSFSGTDLGVTTGPGTTITGRRDGIFARNYGMGALSVTANGDVTGTTSFGIYARNFGSDLDVTTSAGTTVAGAFNGIVAHNYGSGALSVTANGDVAGTNFDGIFARNMTGTDLIVTTGAFSTVTGKDHGTNVRNYERRSDRHRQWRCYRHRRHRHLCPKLCRHHRSHRDHRRLEAPSPGQFTAFFPATMAQAHSRSPPMATSPASVFTASLRETLAPTSP